MCTIVNTLQPRHVMDLSPHLLVKGLVTWWHRIITWIKVELSFIGCWAIHLKAIVLDMFMQSIPITHIYTPTFIYDTKHIYIYTIYSYTLGYWLSGIWDNPRDSLHSERCDVFVKYVYWVYVSTTSRHPKLIATAGKFSIHIFIQWIDSI